MHEIETVCPHCNHAFYHVIAPRSGERLRLPLSSLSFYYEESVEARHITRQLTARQWTCLCGKRMGFNVVEEGAVVALRLQVLPGNDVI